MYQSIEVLEGDGISGGSVRLVKFSPGIVIFNLDSATLQTSFHPVVDAGWSVISSTTERIESVDEDEKSLTYSIIDGDLLKYYKNFKAIFYVSTHTKGNGSVLKLCAEFDKVSEDGPGPDLYKEFVVKNFQDLDAYLLLNKK